MSRGTKLCVAWLVATVAFLAASVFAPTTYHPPVPAVPTTTAVDTTGDLSADKTIEVPESAAKDVATSGSDSHAGARDESPTGVSEALIAEGEAQHAAFAAHDALPLYPPLATQHQAGCSTRLVRNYSSRGGVKPRLIVLHYTVSANRAGWGDVNANVSWFNSSAAQASSNYIIDREGHCAYIVPESLKAWAQANFNPVAISIEIINSGSEGSLISGAGTAKLRKVVRAAAKRWGIPLRAGSTSGCSVTRSGIVDHLSLGACGGGHHDVAPYPFSKTLKAITKSATATGYAALTKGEKANVDELRAQRKIAKRHHGWKHVASYHLARAVKAKNALRRGARFYTAHPSPNRAERAARLAYLKRVIAG